MEKKISFSEILKKYTMVIVLVFVVIMFSVNTKGVMLLPQNVNNLVAQNAYVFILATGMLFCILTGGNIDLSWFQQSNQRKTTLVMNGVTHIFFPNFMYYPRDILLSRRDYKSKKKICFINLMNPNVNLTINILYHTFFNRNSKLGYLCEP